MAVLKQSGNVDSVIQRLIRTVIGYRSESMHDFSMGVGRKSREQVASDEAKRAAFTLAVVAGSK